MKKVVLIDHKGPLAIITIDNPPVNALSHAVRNELTDCLKEALSDPDTRAIILICHGRTFIAGADISEFGKPPRAPHLPDVLQALDSCPLPLIAAMHGTVLGGGLETALACRYRIALDSTRFGLPEVNLGLIPGAGGTQRLPRIAGLENALDMITSGRHVDAAEALKMGLIDKVTTGDDLLQAAMDFANTILLEDTTRPPISEITLTDSADKQQLLEDWKTRVTKTSRGQTSPLIAIESIRNAVELPFKQGLERERRLFMDCVSSAQSKALRYIFFAERTAAKLPAAVAGTPMAVRSAAIIGGGTMGRGIAMCFANKNFPVCIIETAQARLKQALDAIETTYTKMEVSGRINAQQKQECLGLISGSCDYASVLPRHRGHRIRSK
jgi:3-hydroxyacyl-CoA dehydrogenase